MFDMSPAPQPATLFPDDSGMSSLADKGEPRPEKAT